MKKVHVFEEIEAAAFPAGRRTRVMHGENGAADGAYFRQGYVVVYPGGSIPLHEHFTMEAYTVLEGEGEIVMAGKTKPVRAGDTVYIDNEQPHTLVNTQDTDLHMLFVHNPQAAAEQMRLLPKKRRTALAKDALPEEQERENPCPEWWNDLAVWMYW